MDVIWVGLTGKGGGVLNLPNQIFMEIVVVLNFLFSIRVNEALRRHSGCLDSKKILSTIDAPPGVPGVSKNQIFFSTNENVFLLR